MNTRVRRLDAKRIGAMRIQGAVQGQMRAASSRVRSSPVRAFQAAEVSLEDFVNKHLALIDFLNEKGEKGECVTYDEIVEFVGSEELADKHIQCLEIEEAFVNALPDVFCSLTAVIKRKEEMLP
ncbi:hypothetical protein DRJ19_04100 [Candidatus Woesearchaeota archaeon]|nr:MAG: hypothetical protein DRJ19_04100 [Candidatus Woesearchaeota archaeon]